MKGPEHINYISQKIYTECYGSDIHIKSDDTFSLSRNGQIVNRIPWPYGEKMLESLIAHLSQNEPYGLVVESDFIGGLDGREILKCKDNELTIIERKYLWNKVELTFPGAHSTVQSDQSTTKSGGTDNILFTVVMATALILSIIASIYFLFFRKNRGE